MSSQLSLEVPREFQVTVLLFREAVPFGVHPNWTRAQAP